MFLAEYHIMWYFSYLLFYNFKSCGYILFLKP